MYPEVDTTKKTFITQVLVQPRSNTPTLHFRLTTGSISVAIEVYITSMSVAVSHGTQNYCNTTCTSIGNGITTYHPAHISS